MTSAATLEVRIIGDSSKLRSELQRATGETRTLGSRMAGIGRIAATGLAVASGALAAFGAKAVQSAGDLNESLSKMGAILGEGVSSQVEQFADSFSKQFGLVKQELIDGASAFGGLFKLAGQSGEQLGTMSSDFARLAADASSFFNVPLEEALQKLRAGLTGEAEPLRAFNVFLSEAAVAAEAAELGFGAAGGELTEQQKIMARAKLIMEQMADVQGDLNRTQDSFSNQLRKVKGQMEGVATTIGQQLLPGVGNLLAGLSPVIPVLGEGLAGAVEGILPLFESLVPLLAQVVPVAAALVTALAPVASTILDAIATAIGNLLPALEPLIAALGEGLLDVVTELAPVLPELATALAQLVLAITPLLPIVTSLAVLLAQGLTLALRGIVTTINNVVIPGFRLLVGAALDLAGQVLGAATTAFGWIPGIGPKLHDASAKFASFRDQVNSALAGIKDRNVTVTTTFVKKGVDQSGLPGSPHAGPPNPNNPKRHAGGMIYHAGGYVSMHAGGIGPDERVALLQTGEGVLRRSAVQRIGGPGAINTLNSGGSIGGRAVNVYVSVGGSVVAERELTETIRTTLERIYNRNGLSVR